MNRRQRRGPGTCKRRVWRQGEKVPCGEPTVSQDVELCPKHWEATHHTAYPMMPWLTEEQKLAAWVYAVPTPVAAHDLAPATRQRKAEQLVLTMTIDNAADESDV